MSIEYGKHDYMWREVSLRFVKTDNSYHDDYFLELNIWFYFVTISFKGKICRGGKNDK